MTATQPEGLDMTELTDEQIIEIWKSYLSNGLCRDITGFARALLSATPSVEPVAWFIADDNGEVYRATGYEHERDQWRAVGHEVHPLYTAPQPSPTAVVLDDRVALRILFEEAFNAGWDRSDECDNAYNNGTSEQLSEPPQAQEPQVFQEWRAQYFSDRSEVVERLLSRFVRQQVAQPVEQTTNPVAHARQTDLDYLKAYPARALAVCGASDGDWNVPLYTTAQPVEQTRAFERIGYATLHHGTVISVRLADPTPRDFVAGYSGADVFIDQTAPVEPTRALTDERPSFEAAWRQEYPMHGETTFKRSGFNPDAYVNTRVQDGWLMWQARAKTGDKSSTARPASGETE